MEPMRDLLIMGAGPAGTALATLLSKNSGGKLRITLLESERHPRHHIGESLLPASMPLLAELGVPAETLAARFQHKYGARFYDPPTERLVTFGFEPTPGSVAPSFQVFREEFDALLAARARQAGCEILENTTVEAVEETAVFPRVSLRDGRRLEARFLVDATGRDALLATKRKEKQLMGEYGRVGIYNYFADLPPHDERDGRYITMYLFGGAGGGSGWVWLIPLRDGRTSVGIVFREMPADMPSAGTSRQEALFWAAVRTMPRLERRLLAARVTDAYRAIGDYSFTVKHKIDPADAPRWAAVGDAAGFLDPIFSSGVHLALSSAATAAPGILHALNGGDGGPLRSYAAHMDAGFSVFRAFVQRFYHRDLVQNLFFGENKPPELHLAITRILAGHVWDPTNPVLKLLGMGRPV